MCGGRDSVDVRVLGFAGCFVSEGWVESGGLTYVVVYCSVVCQGV